MLQAVFKTTAFHDRAPMFATNMSAVASQPTIDIVQEGAGVQPGGGSGMGPGPSAMGLWSTIRTPVIIGGLIAGGIIAALIVRKVIS